MALNTTYTHQTDTSQFQNDRERAHYVYLIKRADGLIKVGVSTNVEKRLSDLAQAKSASSKLPLVVLVAPNGWSHDLKVNIYNLVYLSAEMDDRMSDWPAAANVMEIHANRISGEGSLSNLHHPTEMEIEMGKKSGDWSAGSDIVIMEGAESGECRKYFPAF